MAKQPYIPLYIGDWEQDTNCITAMAEFALLKLTFKLFKAENKGVFATNLRSLTLLFKSSQQETKEILDELIENKILEIEIVSDSEISIKSRRMMREADISDTRSEIGKAGNDAKRTQNARKKNKNKNFASTDTTAKQPQNTDIEIESEVDNEIKIGSVEDEEMLSIFHRWVKYKNDRKEFYKSTDSLNASFEKLKRQSSNNPDVARIMIEDAMGNGWKGFFEPKPQNKPPDSQNSIRGASAVVTAFSNTTMNK